MGFRLLFDEMTEVSFANYCEQAGHDSRRVVSHPALGPGSDDEEILAIAEREARLLVTYDDDFIDEGTARRIGILVGRDDRMDPHRAGAIVDAIGAHVDQQQIEEHDGPFYLSSDWL